MADIKTEIDEDLKKKIESTKFAYIVAASGVGKTFSGDYLEAIRGWKHIDGDIVYKSPSNPEYKDVIDQMYCRGDYADKDVEWKQNESWKAHMKILVRLALEGARDSDTVVLTHASVCVPWRIFVKQQLKDAGAKDVSMVFLHCDFDVRMRACWKRFERLATQAGTTAPELLKNWSPSIVDFDYFAEFYTTIIPFVEPDESEQPYKVVDVTAKDWTVFDGLDEAFGIDKTKSRGRGDLSYDELASIIREVDEKRDQEYMGSGYMEIFGDAEKELEEMEPEKVAARRSSLIELDKLDSSFRLSGRSSSSVLSNSSHRLSFIKTGRFEE